jgi:insertion element IS1 protein InsB
LAKLDIRVCISAECDEQWSFVGRKKHKRWLWYILEKTTRKVLAFTFGKRNNETYQKLIDLLPEGLIDRLDTDDWKSYKSIRFTPIHNIGKDLTWRIERKNLDLRTRIKRLARRTICFSKSELMHDTVIGRFIYLYLF